MSTLLLAALLTASSTVSSLRGGTSPEAPTDLVCCGRDEVFVIESEPATESPRKRWTWRPADSPGISEEAGPLFRTTDECKPIGDMLLITSSSGGVALVRRQDRRCLFLARATNAHSACLVPGNRIAVAASTGGDELLLFDREHSGLDAEPVARWPLHGAHGVHWDGDRRRLWALGTDELLRIDLGNEEADPEIVVEATFALPTRGGHDLSPARDGCHLFVTTDTHVYLFDREDGSFRLHPQLGNVAQVKSVDVHPETGRLVYVRADESWWSDTIRFAGSDAVIRREGEIHYKARWDVAAPLPQQEGAATGAADGQPFFKKRVVLHRSRPGAWAIPKLLVAAQGTVLVFAQDRAGGDWGRPIDPVVVRSLDGGVTFGEPQLRAELDDPTDRNFIVKPTGVVQDRRNGRIFVFLSRSPLRTGDGRPLNEVYFYEHIQETRRLGRAWFLIHSDDEGATWSEPEEITAQLLVEAHWQEWSPVHEGIQLERGPHAGRLVVPVRIYAPEEDPSEHDVRYQTNGVLFSDDGGRTWIPGGRALPFHGECSVAELGDGAVYLNHRRARGQDPLRSWSISRDGGATFTEHGSHDDLPDQRCHAGLVRLRQPDGTSLLLLSNVPGPRRENLVISSSSDEGRTWTRRRTVEPGHVAYSCLAVLADDTVLCLYETGEETSRRDLALARFDLAWLLVGSER